MIVIIIIVVIAFLYWSLVSAKPKKPTFNDILNEADRTNGSYMNVYKHQYTGMYYGDKTPINPDDKKVFSGTRIECENYVSKRM